MLKDYLPYYIDPLIVKIAMVVLFLIAVEIVYIKFVKKFKIRKGEDRWSRAITLKMFSFMVVLCLVYFTGILILILMIIAEYWREILTGLGIIAIIVMYFVINKKVADKISVEETEEEVKERHERYIKKYDLKFVPGEKVRLISENDNDLGGPGYRKGDIVTIKGFYNKGRHKNYRLEGFNNDNWFNQDLFAKIKPKKRKSNK